MRHLVLSCALLCVQTAFAQTFTRIHTFHGTDGSFPLGGLVFDENGVLYGTTESGGTGAGTVYSLTPNLQNADYDQAVIHTFAGTDGQAPSGTLVSAKGVLYGTAPEGGTASAGTVFQLTPGVPGAPWKESTLYDFQAGADGRGSFAGLTLGPAGVLYGTTAYGGNASCTSGLGCGTVFQVSPPIAPGHPWTETVLHRFESGNDGANPSAGLALASDGSLYGTAGSGGATGAGIVFRLTPPGKPGIAWKESIVYSFQAGEDGEQPLAAVVLGKNGNLFGTTLGGGTSGCGTVFELTPPEVKGDPWNKQIIHSFTCSDGAYPEGAVLLQPGVIYGTTSGGGSTGAGVIYSLQAPVPHGGAWTETTLYNFRSSTDGSNPVSSLILGKNGSLLGTAMSGGVDGEGTVFKVVP